MRIGVACHAMHCSSKLLLLLFPGALKSRRKGCVCKRVLTENSEGQRSDDEHMNVAETMALKGGCSKECLKLTNQLINRDAITRDVGSKKQRIHQETFEVLVRCKRAHLSRQLASIHIRQRLVLQQI